PGAVYSTPITAHDQTLITASEVTIGMGMGFGSGTSTGPESTSGAERSLTSKGGGGGGGGRSNARPVAIISVNPAGVRIQPIIDVNRLALTATSTLGALLILRAVRRLRAKS
ncbi:MAG TPA: spore germination protein GerW family protein, partial [Ktedonobacterales bacterium]